MSKEKLKTVSIKGKLYVPVNERIRYFNEAYKNGAILTQIMNHENDSVLIEAKVIPDVENEQRFFTGYAQETKGKGMVNATSYIENCETSAVGRALGFMGIGVESSIASAEEVSNAIAQQKEPKVVENSNTEIKEPQPLSKSTNRKVEFKPEPAQNEEKKPKATSDTPQGKKAPKKANISEQEKQDALYFVEGVVSKTPDEIGAKDLKESFKLMKKLLGEELFKECLGFWGKRVYLKLKKYQQAS